MLFSTLVQILPHVREGRLKGLAVTSATRSALAPELPTMVESGYDQLVTTSVSLIVAPPGTPLAIREQINKATAAALDTPEVKQVFSNLGAEAKIASPDDVSAYLADAEKRWSGFIAASKLSIE